MSNFQLDGGEGGSSSSSSFSTTFANRTKFNASNRDVPLIFVSIDSDEFITRLHSNLLSLKISYTMDEASALSFDIIDPGFEMGQNNYFQPGQTLVYKSLSIDDVSGPSTNIFGQTYYGYPFEIADVSYSQSQGASPIVTISAYTKAIQQMKRDRTEVGSIKGSGTNFVRNAARKYGLEFVGEQTTKSQSITKASGEQQAESLWDVIKKLAGDAKFVCFEADGTLYFGSQKWLLHKWGVEKYTFTKYNKKLKKDVDETRYRTFLTYPPHIDSDTKTINTKFILQQLPQMQNSINDPLEGSGTCIVDRQNGVRLRPGMTVYVGEVPYLSGHYLISSVEYEEMSPDPVVVNFRTVERLAKDIKQIAIGHIWPGRHKFPTNAFGANSRTDSGSYQNIKGGAVGGGGGEVF